ncbi:MAG: hypothetical protein JEZ08_06910 [Clostridiales bacterium]|nr:hypothetical protein [Clostridiales bacterium]
MPIKPIDMQVLLPNVRRAARPDNVKLAKEEMAMQQQQITEDKELQKNLNKVSNLEKKDQNEIKDDQKESRNQSESSKKKKREKEEEEKKIQMREHGSTFDIKV